MLHDHLSKYFPIKILHDVAAICMYVYLHTIYESTYVSIFLYTDGYTHYVSRNEKIELVCMK